MYTNKCSLYIHNNYTNTRDAVKQLSDMLIHYITFNNVQYTVGRGAGQSRQLIVKD